MRISRYALWLLATLASGACSAQGLAPPADTPWPRWQWRAQSLVTPGLPGSGAASESRGAQGLQLFGDYYLFDLRSAGGGFAGGLRATSGLTVGARGLAAGLPPDVAGAGLSWRGHPAGLGVGGDAGFAPLPYVGVGVTGLSLRGGWGVSADIGFAGVTSGNGLRLRGGRGDGSSAEDLLREWRLAPMLQLGVTYSF